MSKQKTMSIAEVCATANNEDSADRLREFIESICIEYGQAFDIPAADVFASIEARRDYWAVNYYQRANFPSLSDVTIYDSSVRFLKVCGDQGFRCPACGGVSTNPTVCNSGELLGALAGHGGGGKVCDWKAYGLLGTLGKGHRVLMRDAFPEHLKPLTVFMPVALEGVDPAEYRGADYGEDETDNHG